MLAKVFLKPFTVVSKEDFNLFKEVSNFVISLSNAVDSGFSLRAAVYLLISSVMF